jgi:hypothetical protein
MAANDSKKFAVNAWFDLLFGNPPEMLLQGRIGPEPFRAIDGFSQRHLIIDIVNAVMALAADGDAPAQRLPCICFFEIDASVKLPGNEMMKSQSARPSAERAGTLFFPPGGACTWIEIGHWQPIRWHQG